MPSVVLDFANGLYWDGTVTSTDPSVFLTAGTVTPGITTGLGPLTGTVITAKGALLTALEAAAYALQCTTFNIPSTFTGAGAVIANQASDYLILADNGGAVESLTSGGSHLTLGNADWPLGTTISFSSNSSLRRISCVSGGATGTVGASTADTNPIAANTTVYIGSNNGSIPPGGGYVQSLAMYGQLLPNQIIPVPAFTSTNGIWWNGSATNAIDYGNVLQIEYTQALTMIAAICVGFNVGSGVDTPTGLISGNVQALAPFTGYEFWINGSGFIDFRLQHAEGANSVGVYGSTNVCDGLWHVVAVTSDGSGTAAGVNLYVDGVLETMTTEFDNLGGLSIKSASNDFQLWNSAPGSTAPPGALGLYRQYNVVKSQSFIQSFVIDTVLPSIDGTCVLAPKLDEGGSNLVTRDLSSSGLAGTLTSTGMWLRAQSPPIPPTSPSFGVIGSASSEW